MVGGTSIGRVVPRYGGWYLDREGGTSIGRVVPR